MRKDAGDRIKEKAELEAKRQQDMMDNLTILAGRMQGMTNAIIAGNKETANIKAISANIHGESKITVKLLCDLVDKASEIRDEYQRSKGGVVRGYRTIHALLTLVFFFNVATLIVAMLL